LILVDECGEVIGVRQQTGSEFAMRLDLDELGALSIGGRLRRRRRL